MENENIGKRLLEVRTRKNYTQELLAEKVGTSPSYISNIERIGRCPSLSLLRKIVKELDTTYDYLLMQDFTVDKRLQIKYQDMFKELKKLDVETQDEFLDLANKMIDSFKKIEKNNKK